MQHRDDEYLASIADEEGYPYYIKFREAEKSRERQFNQFLKECEVLVSKYKQEFERAFTMTDSGEDESGSEWPLLGDVCNPHFFWCCEQFVLV